MPQHRPARVAFSQILTEQSRNRAGEDPVRPTFLPHEVIWPEEAEVCSGSQVDGRDRTVGSATPGVEPIGAGQRVGMHGFR